jgi:hypothetical protein
MPATGREFGEIGSELFGLNCKPNALAQDYEL